MFQVRIEKDFVVRTYTADALFDAVELFHELSKVLPFVQVWQGDKLIHEYKVDWAEGAERYIHENPLCG